MGSTARSRSSDRRSDRPPRIGRVRVIGPEMESQVVTDPGQRQCACIRRSARRPAWATCLAGARRRIIMGARCNRERGGSSRPVMPVKRALKANAGDQEMLKNSAPPILHARFGVAMVRRARSHLNRVGADQAGLHVARGKPRGRRAGQVGGEGGSSGQDFQLRTSSSQSNSI